MAVTITLPADEVEELVWDSVEDMIVGTTRWEVQYESIVEYDGAYWRVDWSKGATESQDYSSFRGLGYDPEPMVLTKVEKRIVSKEVWAEVDE